MSLTWLKEAVSDNKTGRVSSSRIVMLISGVTLCLSTLWLTVAAYWRIELVPALTVFGGSLATMAGAGYVSRTIAEKKNDKVG